MKVFDAAAIRNVALVGHTGSGKTQLASALLFDAGAAPRLGLVDEGTAVTDYDDEALARRHTLAATPALLEWQHTKINLIDTPGVANFVGEARAALRAVDAALVVVDAVSGVQVSTEKIWAAAEEAKLARMLVCSRMDRERASLERAVASMRETLARTCVPVQWPIGEADAFTGVVDLVTRRAYTFARDGSGTMTEGDVPEASAAAVEAARTALIEMVAETDDALMEQFFEAGTLDESTLADGLARAVARAAVFPVYCASGLLNIGIPPLADAIVRDLPSPATRPFPGLDASGAPAAREASDTAPLELWVWKTMADPFAGRISLFRVISGVARSDATVRNLTREADERLGHLLVLEGKAQTHVAELHAGDLGAVAKLKDTHTGDRLGDRQADFTVPPIVFPEPVLSYAIEPKSRADEDKIGPAMQRLLEEDPGLGYDRDPQTHELLLSGQGQLHIEVTVAKLRRRFGVEVTLKPPRIAYLETITASVEAHGRHKKQTGGHGQFGDCKIRMEPLPRGSDFEFVDDIFGGAIPRQFVPAVEKGIQEARGRGFLAGYPVVDFRVTVYDGAYHDVDSNELSFKLAGRLAFRDAMSRARPTLLEPIMRVEVSTPSDHAGDLMGDLNARRGRIAGMEARGSTTLIRAAVPMAEMLTYEQTLTSHTGGRGAYHMEFSHYDEVPGHLQSKIISAARTNGAAAREEEE